MIPLATGEVFSTFTDSFTTGAKLEQRGIAFYNSINQTMCEYSKDASVVFTGLPSLLPDGNSNDYNKLLGALSDNLPPVVMVYGSMSVLTNSL